MVGGIIPPAILFCAAELLQPGFEPDGWTGRGSLSRVLGDLVDAGERLGALLQVLAARRAVKVTE